MLTPSQINRLKTRLAQMFQDHKSGKHTISPINKVKKTGGNPPISIMYLLSMLQNRFAGIDVKSLCTILNELKNENMISIFSSDDEIRFSMFMNAISGKENGEKLKEISDTIKKAKLSPNQKLIHSQIEVI